MTSVSKKRYPPSDDGTSVLDRSAETDADSKEDTGIVEISELKDELALHRARYHSLVGNNKVGIATTSVTGKFTSANKALCRMIGYSEKELIGKRFADFLHDDDKNHILKLFFNAFKNPTNCVELEFRVIHKDGHVVHMLSNPTIFMHKGIIKGFQAMAVDISNLKRVEQALEESEEKYKKIFETTGTAMLLIEEDSTISLVNHEFEKISGYDRAEVELKRSWMDFTAEEDLQRLKSYHLMRRIDSNSVPKQYQARFRNRHGELRDVLVNIDLIPSTQRSIASILDITNQVQLENDLRDGYSRIKRILNGTVDAMAAALESRDMYTAGHQERVARLACSIARDISLNEEQIECLNMSSILHDIGKIQIPTEILNKPSKLTPVEFELIKAHPEIGYNILRKIDFGTPVAMIVRQHHERINGSGYPLGLSSHDIVLEAKILAVADVVEAMSSHRPYRPALGLEKALNHVTNNKGLLYDRKVVESCLRVAGTCDLETAQ